MQTDSSAELLDAIVALQPVLKRCSREAEQLRQLPAEVVEALRQAGFYRMFRPRELGGYGLDPVTEFQVAEALARIDSAAAWNVQVCNAGELYGGWFTESATQEVFGNVDSIVAGAFNPRRRADAEAGGYRLNGVTPFTSNCHGADWVMGTADPYDDGVARVDADNNPVMLLTLVPASECTIVDNWDAMGLAGTGSHDVFIDDVFVPANRAVVFSPTPQPSGAYDNALCRMAIWVTAGCHAAVALGIAQAAIDDLIAMGSRVPAYADAGISSRSRVQLRLAQAEVQLASARAYFHQTYAQAFEDAGQSGSLTLGQKGRCQAASTHVVMAAASAVDLVHSCVGTAGVRRTHFFEKYFRDAHVVTQHAFVTEARLEAVGQILFGKEPDWPFFAF
ncbi:MAG: acyl-CoA dehydrogenase family protein [Pseudomonadota bacterium]